MTRRAGADGTFRFEHLTPGRWDVVKRDEEIGRYGEAASFEGGFFAKRPTLPWVCIVEEGKTTRYDLDLTRGAGCFLKGKLTLDGKPPAPWSATIVEDKNQQIFSSDSPPVTLDFEGGFTLFAETPGRYFLFLSGTPKEGRYLRIRDEVTLAKGENPWSLDLTLGEVILENPARLHEEGSLLLYLWKGMGDLEAVVQIKTDGSVETQALTVPAGKGWIIRARPDFYLPEGFMKDAVQEVDVLAGGAVIVKF